MLGAGWNAMLVTGHWVSCQDREGRCPLDPEVHSPHTTTPPYALRAHLEPFDETLVVVDARLKTPGEDEIAINCNVIAG